MKRASGAIAGLLAVCTSVGACGDIEQQPAGAPSASPSPASAEVVLPSHAAAPSPDPYADLLTGVRLCTDELDPLDDKIWAAITAARAGTRTVAEIASSFREVQDAVERLVPQVPADFRRLAEALQSYADALGRARVSGAGGIAALSSAREQLDAACLAPAAASG